MKSSRFLPPFIALAFAWLVFVVYVWMTSGQLPEQVATHFGASGLPNGWQTHAGYLEFTLLFGTATPAFVLGTFALMRLANGWGLNISHKDYWLAPERRQETFGFVQRQGIRFAGLLVAFFAGMHYLILVANAQRPVTLPGTVLLWIVGPFLGATLLWAAIFIIRFSRKPV